MKLRRCEGNPILGPNPTNSWEDLAVFIASVIVCLQTRPETDEVLESFYRNLRPWGYWRPVYNKLA